MHVLASHTERVINDLWLVVAVVWIGNAIMNILLPGMPMAWSQLLEGIVTFSMGALCLYKAHCYRHRRKHESELYPCCASCGFRIDPDTQPESCSECGVSLAGPESVLKHLSDWERDAPKLLTVLGTLFILLQVSSLIWP